MRSEKASILSRTHHETTEKVPKDYLWTDALLSAVPAAGQSPGHPVTRDARGVLTVIAREVLNGHVLDGDLLEEVGFLTARVARDDSFLPEPLAQPRQVAVTVERIGQEISKHHRQTRHR